MWVMRQRCATDRGEAPGGRGVASRRRTCGLWLLGTAAVAGASATVLRLRSPEVPGSWGLCPWLLLTGLPCPTCGGLRAAARLTHLDLAGALAMNGYIAVSMLALTAAWLVVAVATVRAGGRWFRAAPGWGLNARRLAGGPGSAAAFALAFGWWAAGLLAFGALRLIPSLQLPLP